MIVPDDAFEAFARKPLRSQAVPLQYLREGAQDREAAFLQKSLLQYSQLHTLRLRKEYALAREELRKRFIDCLVAPPTAAQPEAQKNQGIPMDQAWDVLKNVPAGDVAPDILLAHDVEEVLHTLMQETLAAVADVYLSGLTDEDVFNELEKEAAAHSIHETVITSYLMTRLEDDLELFPMGIEKRRHPRKNK